MSHNRLIRVGQFSVQFPGQLSVQINITKSSCGPVGPRYFLSPRVSLTVKPRRHATVPWNMFAW